MPTPDPNCTICFGTGIYEQLEWDTVVIKVPCPCLARDDEEEATDPTAST